MKPDPEKLRELPLTPIETCPRCGRHELVTVVDRQWLWFRSTILGLLSLGMLGGLYQAADQGLGAVMGIAGMLLFFCFVKWILDARFDAKAKLCRACEWKMNL